MENGQEMVSFEIIANAGDARSFAFGALEAAKAGNFEEAEEIALDEYVMKNQLDAGKVLICSMRAGDFTSVGHFVMIYGYNADGFFINDANCIYRSSQIWSYETLENQIRILWAFEKK